VRPRKALSLALATLAGLLLAGGVLVAAEKFQPCVYRAEELSGGYGLPVLGQLPHLPEPLRGGVRLPELICRALPHSPMAEAYRMARTHIEFLRRRHDLRAILITSPTRQDGKTMAAANLAVCLADAGRRVLLVDA